MINLKSVEQMFIVTNKKLINKKKKEIADK